MKSKIKNGILNIVIVILILAILGVWVLYYFKNNNNSNNQNTDDIQIIDGGNTDNNDDNDNTDDVASLNEIDLKKLIDIIDNKKNSILYIGRETCSACVSFMPKMLNVHKELKIKADFLDLAKYDLKSNDFSYIIKKFNKVVTKKVNNETYTDTIGSFIGWTPMIIIIRDGEAIDVSIGALTEGAYNDFLSRYV